MTIFTEKEKQRMQLARETQINSTRDINCFGTLLYILGEQEIDQYIYLDPDIVITSRWFDSLYLENTSKKIVWFQDAHFADPNRPDALSKADLMICSSSWHRHYIAERYAHGIDARKLEVIPLGIRKELFRQSIDRDSNKVIYSSNPDRGLYILIDMWKEIYKLIPDIHLDIYYGWEGLRTWSDTKNWSGIVENQYSSTMQKIDSFNNISFKGRLTKRELAREMLSATLCLYPNNFQETFCLTSLETQVAGVPTITTDSGALSTTLNRECNVLIDKNPFSIEYKNRFIKETVDLFNDNSRVNMWSKSCRDYVMYGKHDWSDIGNIWDEKIFKV